MQSGYTHSTYNSYTHRIHSLAVALSIDRVAGTGLEVVISGWVGRSQKSQVELPPVIPNILSDGG